MTARNFLRNAALAALLALALPSLAMAERPDIPGISVPDLPDGALDAIKSQQRLALVIGNGKYPSSPLRKPSQDATSMAAALNYLGFKVESHVNLNGEQMKRAIDSFAERLEASGAIGLFYYSGHGVQTSDGGYLLPINLPPEADETAIQYGALPLGYVLQRMEGAREGVDILLIDACRNNPWVRSFKGISSEGGTLRPAPAGKRSLIGFSTRLGSVASEGNAAEAHSIFTQHLLKAMFQPGLQLRNILDQVQEEVRTDTNNLQIPDYSSTLGTREVYLIPPATTQARSRPIDPPRDEVRASLPPPPSLQNAPMPTIERVFGDTVDARVVLRAMADAWIQVRSSEGLLTTRLLKRGDAYRVPNRDDVTLMTGNAGGLVIEVDGVALPPLGRTGEVRRDVSLDVARLKVAAGHPD